MENPEDNAFAPNYDPTPASGQVDTGVFIGTAADQQQQELATRQPETVGDMEPPPEPQKMNPSAIVELQHALRAKIAEVNAFAASKGRPAPSIDERLLSADPTAPGTDLATLAKGLDDVQKDVSAAEGAQLQEQMGEVVETVVAVDTAAAIPARGGLRGAAGLQGLLDKAGLDKESLAQLGISGDGQHLPSGALATEHGGPGQHVADLPELKQRKGGSELSLPV